MPVDREAGIAPWLVAAVFASSSDWSWPAPGRST
jgi:hypothetical protein